MYDIGATKVTRFGIERLKDFLIIKVTYGVSSHMSSDILKLTHSGQVVTCRKSEENYMTLLRKSDYKSIGIKFIFDIKNGGQNFLHLPTVMVTTMLCLYFRVFEDFSHSNRSFNLSKPALISVYFIKF